MSKKHKIKEEKTEEEKVKELILPYWNDDTCLPVSDDLLKGRLPGDDLRVTEKVNVKTIQNTWFHSLVKWNCVEEQNKNTGKIEFAISKEMVTRARKIRIYMKNWREVNNFLGLSRYWFNQTIEYLKQPDTIASLYNVRKVIRGKQHPEWAWKCPQRIREFAIKDACKAVSNAKKKCMITGEFQEVWYRSKKGLKQGFGFDRHSVTITKTNEGFVFKEHGHRLYFKSQEPLPEGGLEGSRVVKEGQRWFLILPEQRHVYYPENQRNGVVALDPGIRTFQAFYSNGLIGKLGEGDFQKIYRLCLRIDKIISKMKKVKARERYRLKQAKTRMLARKKDWITDMHNKIAYFLVTNFDTIVIPTFKAGELSRKLISKTARNLLNFAHGRFIVKLKEKAREYGCKVIQISEAYTSKTCSYCGKQHKIGSKKIMKCCCGEVDRDLQGARGIYVKYMSKALLASTLS